MRIHVLEASAIFFSCSLTYILGYLRGYDAGADWVMRVFGIGEHK